MAGPLDYDRLMGWDIPEIRQRYSARDTMLYALGVGLGADPLDSDQLRFVAADEPEVLPTMCCVLGRSDMWLADPATGLDFNNILHAGMGFEIHAPLPPEGDVLAKTRVTDIFDKGAGAMILEERVISDRATGRKLATATSAVFARGHGSFGGARGPSAEPVALDRAPDLACDLATLPQAALVYRLSGDVNPLHSDPEMAAAAGFERPILHGLCTFAVAGHALLKTLCGYDPGKLTAMRARFTAPVFPGQTIRTEIWRGEGEAAFRAHAVETGAVVLDQGLAGLS